MPPSRWLVGGLVACLAAATLLLTLFWVHYYSYLPARLVWNGLAFIRHEVTGPAIDRHWVYTDARVRPMQSKLALTVMRGRYDFAFMERKLALRFPRAGVMPGGTREPGTRFVILWGPGSPPVVFYSTYIERDGYTWYAEFSERLDQMPTQAEVTVLSDRRAEIFEKLAALLAALIGRG